ncbi:hypothetical protein Tco_1440828 [Tanacetum coccineum]
MMFQQHQGESLSEAWTRFKDLLQKVPYHGIDLWLQVQIFYDHVNPITRRTIDQSAGGKLCDRNAKESRALLEDLALYDNESWNDPRDFAKLVKAIALPQDVPSTSDRRLIELENQYCMEDPKQAFVEYASSRTDEAGEGLVSNFMASQDARLSKFESDFKQQQSEMTNKIDTMLKVITDRIAGALPSDTVKNPKLSASPVLSARSYPNTDPQCSNHVQVRSTPSQSIPINKATPMMRQQKIMKKKKRISWKISMSTPPHRPIHPLRSSPKSPQIQFIRRIAGIGSSIIRHRDFMIVEDISSIIDPRLSQVVLGKPFVEISNMTHDSPEGVVRFTNRTKEVAYKMPHMIEQYNSLSDLEKEHTKSVYLRNEEDKRRGVEYVMRKILEFYKECLELGPEYVTKINDEGEVT